MDRLKGLSSEQLWERHLAARTELTLAQKKRSLSISPSLDSDSSLEFATLPLGSVAQRQWGQRGKYRLEGLSLEQLWEHHVAARTELTLAQEVPQPEAGSSRSKEQMHLIRPAAARRAEPAYLPPRRVQRGNMQKRERTAKTEEGNAEPRFDLGAPPPRTKKRNAGAAAAAASETSPRPSVLQEGSFIQPVNTVRNHSPYCMNSFLELTSS